MRIIKFRAYHPDQGKMYYFDSLLELAKFQEGDEGYRGENSEDALVRYMQFTGFYDRYNKPIYEGDIFIINSLEHIVVWSKNGMWSFMEDLRVKGALCEYGIGNLEIVGNSYEGLIK